MISLITTTVQQPVPLTSNIPSMRLHAHGEAPTKSVSVYFVPVYHNDLSYVCHLRPRQQPRQHTYLPRGLVIWLIPHMIVTCLHQCTSLSLYIDAHETIVLCLQRPTTRYISFQRTCHLTDPPHDRHLFHTKLSFSICKNLRHDTSLPRGLVI